jgi:hypothetical protein
MLADDERGFSMDGELSYAVLLVQGYTKEGLRRRLAERLEDLPRKSIVHIHMGTDWQFFWPFWRAWAFVVVDRAAAAPVSTTGSVPAISELAGGVAYATRPRGLRRRASETA